jgi:O-acetyl-ADP-ribose deacetylase
MELAVAQSRLVLKQGDITLEDVDAIVNAANSSLMGGGGVDGAIHRAGGPTILEECKQIRRRQGELPTGEAVITTGGNLNARYVIHTVGPVWHGGSQNEDILLANAYMNSIALAVQHKINTIAFPSISTGIYGFPVERASRIAFTTVSEFLTAQAGINEVRFIVFSRNDFELYSLLFKTDKEKHQK